MKNEIEIGETYLAMIIGYQFEKGYVLLQFDNKYTAYLDISMYRCSNKTLEKSFVVGRFIDVIVQKIDKDGMIICKQRITIEIAEEKKKDKYGKNEDDHLMFNLKSLIDKIR